MIKTENKPLQKPLICPSLHEGHNVHWIQAQQVHNDNWLPVEIRVEGEQSFSIEAEGEGKQIWHNHDPLRLKQAIDLYPKDFFEVSLDSRVLRVKSEYGHYLFSFSTKPVTACPEGTLTNWTLVH